MIGELTHARARNKRTVALMATEGKIEGPYTENERIVLDPGCRPQHSSSWRACCHCGERVELCTLKVIILPGELAAKLRGDDVRCQFRFRHENWIGPWQEAFIH